MTTQTVETLKARIEKEVLAAFSSAGCDTDSDRSCNSIRMAVQQIVELVQPVEVFDVQWAQRVEPRPLSLIYYNDIGGWVGGWVQVPMPNQTKRAVYLGNAEAFIASDELMEKVVAAGAVLND